MPAANYVVMTLVHVYAHVGCNTCVFTCVLQILFSSALVGAVAKQQGSGE